MIKSGFFWVGIILLAIIPLLCMDIAKHNIDWQSEVRYEIITLVQGSQSFDKQEKAKVLDNILRRNQTLNFLIYAKVFSSLILLTGSIYFLRRYAKKEKPDMWRPILFSLLVMMCFIAAKLLLAEMTGTNNKIKMLSLSDDEYSLERLYNDKFKGSVLYVDFWGTTCGACLQEFRDFTAPLKAKYKGRKDIHFLYVAEGRRYLWKQQINKYNVEGAHIFLDDDQYLKLYRHSVRDSTNMVTMPRYLIMDKKGTIAVTNANQPNSRDALYRQLDKYLQEN